ncbi:hypothetical protein Tco_0807409 [Tanacetum coccineum]
MWSPAPVIYNKHALWGISHWGRKRQQFYGFAVNKESAHDVYSRQRIITVTKLQIVEWHNYKHLDWITIRRDDDKLYKFKKGDYKRLRLQDIEDMLLLLKHCHPNVYGRSSIRCWKLPKEAQPHKAGHNKDQKNKLIRIDELHKFSDGKERAGAMIQAIDKQLKNRRIMRSLEKFVSGRPYEGDLHCWKGPYDLSYDVLIIKRYGYSKKRKKTAKAGQTRTWEWIKNVQEPKVCYQRSKSQLMHTRSDTRNATLAIRVLTPINPTVIIRDPMMRMKEGPGLRGAYNNLKA